MICSSPGRSHKLRPTGIVGLRWQQVSALGPIVQVRKVRPLSSSFDSPLRDYLVTKILCSAEMKVHYADGGQISGIASRLFLR